MTDELFRFELAIGVLFGILIYIAYLIYRLKKDIDEYLGEYLDGKIQEKKLREEIERAVNKYKERLQ